MGKVNVGLVGVTGYTGMELARLLHNHPIFTLVRATSRAEAGKKLQDIYPFLLGFEIGGLTITAPDPDDLAEACGLVFLAVPHGTAMEIAGVLRRRKVRVVDLSADFRIRDAEVYNQWYGLKHKETEILEEAVYGLPELYAGEISQADMIANPGCYPTASILAVNPALRAGVIDPHSVIIDAKSGSTGAGRKAAVPTLFCEVSDSFRAYNLGKHRHTPEIEQELGAIAGTDLRVIFSPHLIPMNRGILSTCYTNLMRDVTVEEIQEIYEQAYAPHPWVRVLPNGRLPETRHVRGTMLCDIGLVLEPRTNRLIMVSAIDNLCRGASGQALANANLMYGLPLNTGLDIAPLMP